MKRNPRLTSIAGNERAILVSSSVLVKYRRRVLLGEADAASGQMSAAKSSGAGCKVVDNALSQRHLLAAVVVACMILVLFDVGRGSIRERGRENEDAQSCLHRER